ncbi:hypothetical protein [Demequina sediminicola]|uniref:hypothetical protein n=1 Tax=Demequina sediminicola TaxID=1095026 RepID=UPI000781B8A8|nr:hypothetical protein [Demequina sediminicola]
MTAAGRGLKDTDPFDARTLTALAWRRTAIRIGAVSVVGAQLLALVYGGSAYALGLVGVAVGVMLHVSVSRQYVHHARAVRAGVHDSGMATARTRVALLSLFALVSGVGTLAWLLWEASLA